MHSTAVPCILLLFAGHVSSFLPPNTPLRSFEVKRPVAVAELTSTPTSTSSSHVDAVVVGAGPAGLLSAIMLARKYPTKQVKVYERLPPPPSPTDDAIWSDIAKFYLIGLGGRGQSALQRYGVWEDVKRVCISVVGRKDWAPDAKEDEGVERIFTDRPVTTQILPRDKLVGALYMHVCDKYPNIDVQYGYEIIPMDFSANNNTAVSIRVSKCSNPVARVNPTSILTSATDDSTITCDVENSSIFTTNLLIGADGTARMMANTMEEIDTKEREAMSPMRRLFAEKPFRVKRYVDDNQRVYKTIPLRLPSSWRGDLNYSARTKDGRVNFDALPADANGNYCGVLLLRKSDSQAEANSDPRELRKLLDDSLPQFSKLLDDDAVSTIALKPPSYLPSFRYVGPRLHQGDYTVLLGDSIHTVKPYFGLGANSALEDVTVLEQALDETSSLSQAVKLYSKKRAPESEALVKISRELDRPGLLGAFTFIIPLIMDSIFHKSAPKLFAPNIISMLQKQGITFQGVRRRKQIDRLLQLSILSTGLYASTRASLYIVRCMMPYSKTYAVPMSFTIFLLAILNRSRGRVMKVLNPRQAPADVITIAEGRKVGEKPKTD